MFYSACISPYQPKDKPITIRRGEGGGEWMGGPLWSPARRGMQAARAGHPGHRATIKAHPPTPHPPLALQNIHLPFLRVLTSRRALRSPLLLSLCHLGVSSQNNGHYVP